MICAEPNSLVPPPVGGGPNPVHLALDRLTVISIHLQQFRRRNRHQAAIGADQVERVLRSVEDEMHALSEILIALRDQRSRQ